MKIKQALLALIITPTILFNYAHAGGHDSTPENYIGVGFSSMGSNVSGSTELNLSSLSVMLGRQINDNFSVETRVASGIKEDGNRKLKRLYGLYLKAGIPMSENFYPYAILGYSKASIKSSSSSVVVKSKSDTSMGLGFDLLVSDSFDIEVEYMKYIQSGDLKVGGLSFSFSRDF